MAVVPDERIGSQPDLWHTFAVKAEAIGATVERAPDEVAAARLISAHAGVAKTPPSALACTRSVREQFAGVSAALGAPAATVRRGSDPAAPAAEVIATGQIAVAETGSVLVCERNEDRAACMLAERLWLLVPAEAIVATLDQALARIASLVREAAPYVTLMSGPSRTADIERTLTIGVHGPRALAIVVVGDSER
jgi:L-lactate dehydrogenase complex protein LldG